MKALTLPPLLEKRRRRSSSPTPSLGDKNSHNHHHTAKAAASSYALGVTLPSTVCPTVPDIGEVKCGRGREDVLKVFGSRFLESVERRTREVCLERDQGSGSWRDDTIVCGINMKLF